MDTPAPRLKLRLLICNPKSYGSKNITCKGAITSGTTPRTKEDPYLPSVFSYECKSEAEWQRLTTGISKQVSNQNAFHAYAHFVDPLLRPGPAGRVLCEAGGEYAPPVPVEVAVAAPVASEEEGEVVEIVSTSQENPEPAVSDTFSSEGELDSSDLHKVASAGSIPAPPTISAPEEQSETASEPIAEPEPESAPSFEPIPLKSGEEHSLGCQIALPVVRDFKDKPLYSAAWDKLESPMRLKDLAAALKTDTDTLKTSLQDPLSTVELGHAGWVKRQA